MIITFTFNEVRKVQMYCVKSSKIILICNKYDQNVFIMCNVQNCVYIILLYFLCQIHILSKDVDELKRYKTTYNRRVLFNYLSTFHTMKGRYGQCL